MLPDCVGLHKVTDTNVPAIWNGAHMLMPNCRYQMHKSRQEAADGTAYLLNGIGA